MQGPKCHKRPLSIFTPNSQCTIQVKLQGQGILERHFLVCILKSERQAEWRCVPLLKANQKALAGA